MTQNDEQEETDFQTEKQRNGAGLLRIEKDAIATLPLGQYEGKVVLVSEAADVPAAVRALQKERVLGFDTESRPSFKRGVFYLPSLLQLAGEEAVYLFQLDACGGLPGILPLLTSPDILKTGVAVRDDVKGLQDRVPFAEAGFVEISDFTRRAGVENTGLRALAAHYLGVRISKGAQVTNWANRRLSSQQVIYAATDAWISRELYLRLEKDGLTR